MYKILSTARFKKDLKLALKRNLDVSILRQIVHMLQEGTTLPEQYKDHPLSGVLTGYRECHIKPDWLLIYRINNQELILCLSRTGSHADLFR